MTELARLRAEVLEELAHQEILNDGPNRWVLTDDRSDDPCPVYETREQAFLAMFENCGVESLRAQPAIEGLRPLLVAEIMKLVSPAPIPMERKPTIAEIEKILNSDNPQKIGLAPDGSATIEAPSHTVGDIADAVIRVLRTSAAGGTRDDGARALLERALHEWEAASGVWASRSGPHHWARQAYDFLQSTHGGKGE